MARKRKDQRGDFVHHDEGPEVLGELLAAAGSPLGLGEAIDSTREAQRERRTASEVIPGLWDLFASGRPLPKWRYLDDLPERERRRLEDAFENHDDALVGSLDAAGLSDDGYLATRRLVFELYALIELGRPSGRQELGGARSIPPALRAYADEALFEVEQAEAERVREVVDRSLAELWEAPRR
jgi:hypothetical protein